jgi:P-loop Domain of unknown function (DUF2791)
MAMNESTLAKALHKLGAPASTKGGWERLGFLRNPFPTRSSPIWDVFHNQATVRDRFYSDLLAFLEEKHPTTTLFFSGGNRIGKTHFMEHHRRAVPRALDAYGLVLPIAVVSAEFANFERFYFDMIDQLSDSLHQQTGESLIGEPMTDPSRLSPGDFRRAMEAYGDAVDASEREALRMLLASWIRGERHRQTQRRQLGVVGLVDSPSQVQNTFGGLVGYLRSRSFGGPSGQPSKHCAGVLVFVDEFELVWRQRRDRRDQFLQGLRALIDECAMGGLFFVIGMATGVGPEVGNLEGEYPALFARLKGDRDVPALVEIESAVVGIEYARAFEDFGRNEFLARHPARSKDFSSSQIFTDRDIDRMFRDMLGGAPGATVTQADFFDRLHLAAEARLAESSGNP